MTVIGSIGVAGPASAWTESCSALTVGDNDISFVDNYRGDCSMVQARAQRYWGGGVYTYVYGAQSDDQSTATRGSANSITRTARALPGVGWSPYKSVPAGTTYSVTFTTSH
jgi:hypothetical protein